jgi:hypothetical protein
MLLLFYLCRHLQTHEVRCRLQLLGFTAGFCQAVDAEDNIGFGLNVRVVDTMAPTITCPANIWYIPPALLAVASLPQPPKRL